MYDLPQARLMAPQDDEDDPTIDQVRHVDPREEWGPPLEDLQLVEVGSISSSELLGEEEESSEDSTRPPTSVAEPGESVAADNLPEGAPEFVGLEPAGSKGAHEGNAGGVAYRATELCWCCMRIMS